LLAGRFRAGKGRWVLLGASAVAAAVVTAGVLLQFPRTQANTDPGSAWSIRLEMFRRAARMAAESPVFGIGIGRFYIESSRFASPSSFGPENAHNDLLQVLAEQGAIGLIVLLWMLSTVLMAILQQWRTGHSYCCLSTLAGLTAFLLSGLGGHPLIVLQSAILFWLLLGASTSRAGAGTHPKIRTAVAVVAALVLLSVPFRIMAHRETLQLDATHVAAWDHDGTRGYIKAGPNFVTYLTRQIATLTIPVRLAGPSGSADLAILLRDRLVNRVRVSTDEWYELRLQIPRGSGYEDLRLELRLDESRRDVELLVGEMSFGVRD
jgi:hypothetical protein